MGLFRVNSTFNFVQTIGENRTGHQLITAPLAAAISPFQIPPSTPESEMCETGKTRPDHNRWENPLLFSNSDVGSLMFPTKP